LISIAVLILASCSKDEKSLPVANFDVTVTGEAPNALLVLINNSTDADFYHWEFGEGVDKSESDESAPIGLIIDKAGEITIKLTATSSEGENEISKNINVSGSSSIVSFSNIDFGLTTNDQTYGRSFSIETGEIYLDNEIDELIGSTINLVLDCTSGSTCIFLSPDDIDLNIPSATKTKVMNYDYDGNTAITPEEFDAMADDSQISNLTIVNDENIFPISATSDNHIIMFETSTGKIGAIKTKEYNNDILKVDIKVQKY
jgi:PKD repeat protein